MTFSVPFIETGVSGRVPFRKMFDNKIDAIQDFNKYKSFSNVHHSLYWFKEKEEKFNRDGSFERWGPDYNSAIVDKICFDLDSYKTIRIDNDPIEVYTDDGLESIRKFASWCNKNNYMCEYIFSGGGFYGIVKSEGESLKLRDGMLAVAVEVGLMIDPATIGDTSRMRRVINSYNFKEHRKLYCIPLREEELFLDFHIIRKLAEKPRFRDKFVYGDKSFGLHKYKIDEDKIKKQKLIISLKQDKNADEILEKYGWKVTEFCEPIQHVLSMDYVGHSNRYELIKYFKSVVNMEIEDTVNLLASLLKEEGYHSFIEGQAKYVYTKNRVFNPKKLKVQGICPINCYKCQRLIHI